MSCITVLWMCVQRTRYVSTYLCMKQWIASTLPSRHNGEYSVKCQNNILEKPMDGLKYGEHQLDDI